ncbi:MAG TPA: sugar phosphate isomerase/epimerase family protein [Methylomirabilota bacterium]|jgi:sugar phosphate isomerase/epimerase|nr:sugar phosphate isomerase/epimerase family protein [Methylomirabilota bacterium]
MMNARKLALHTWTLDTTPLGDLLRVARETGWGAVELRRLDFTRAAERGQSAAELIEVVKSSGLPVACVGVEFGWMWTGGPERARLLQVFAEQCERARALGASTVMSPVDRGRGDVAEAAESLREVGDIAARQGVKLALEFNSQAEQLNTLERIRELMARAAHPACGLLLDAYHLGRSGASPRAIEDVDAREIAYVQFSDVPRSGLEPGKALDRLPPGEGSVPFKDFFGVISAKGYAGYLSYEAPNPSAWARPAEEVAREALAATLAVMP